MTTLSMKRLVNLTIDLGWEFSFKRDLEMCKDIKTNDLYLVSLKSDHCHIKFSCEIVNSEIYFSPCLFFVMYKGCTLVDFEIFEQFEDIKKLKEYLWPIAEDFDFRQMK